MCFQLDAKATTTVPPVDGGVSLAAFFHNLLKAKTTDGNPREFISLFDLHL